MKILPFNIPKPHYDNLIYQEDCAYRFYDKLHQHEEIQISLIEKGQGTLIVGDTISDFKAGEVLVLGSNLPHVFKSDSDLAYKSKMITLFFTRESFGSSFFELEELRSCELFFKKSCFGFKVSKPSNSLKDLFLSLANDSKFERFIKLLTIIKQLSSGRRSMLSSFVYEKQLSDSEGERMRNIMEFTTKNFQHTIQLDQVAQVANMTKNSFCKYFKKRTNKTYFRFLNELRVEHASGLLTNSKDTSIADIAEKSGFQNISYFNRTFKGIKGLTPSAFVKKSV